MKKELSMIYLQRDVHSPAEFRVRGSLVHNEDFKRVFSCKEDPVVSKEEKVAEKCDLW